MSDNADVPPEDRTSRTARMDDIEDRAARAEATVKRIWFWLGIIGAIGVAMFALAAYAGSFAHATEVAAIKNEQGAMKEKQAATEATVKQMSDRIGWLCEAFGQLAIQQRLPLPPVPSVSAPETGHGH